MAETKPIIIDNFRGGWNTNEETTINDNQLAEAINVYYGESNLLRTRFGQQTFGAAISGLTSSQSVYGIHFYKESGGTRRLVCHAGTVFYSYNEGTSSWDSELTGLAEVRGQFVVYKDICYYVNGTDYISWDGTTAAQESTPEKVKYMLVKNDIIYGAGVTGSESTLYYSNANPASLKIAFANTDPIDEDNGQAITGLGNIGNFIYVFKEESVYRYEVATPSYQEIDQPIGMKGFRSIVGVDNNVLFQGQDGDIYNTFVLETANARTKAKPITSQLTSYTKNLKNLDKTAAIEWKKFNHVYFAVDPDDTGVPTEILVMNTKLSDLENNIGVFTRYKNVFANDFTLYEDSAGQEHLLVAPAFGGQVMEMEAGLDDDGTQINIEVKTKAYELGEPTIVKYVNAVDGIFHSTDGAVFQFDALGDNANEPISGAEVTVDEETSQPSTLSVNPLGLVGLGGSETAFLRRFKRRLPTYNSTDKVQVHLTELSESHSLVLEKIVIDTFLLGKNIFPTDSIL